MLVNSRIRQRGPQITNVGCKIGKKHPSLTHFPAASEKIFVTNVDNVRMKRSKTELLGKLFLKKLEA